MVSFSRLAVAGFLTSAQLSAGYYSNCVPPTSAQTGYNLESCTGASATCTTADGTFGLFGCAVKKCSKPSSSPTGYDLSGTTCDTASPIMARQCTVACAADYGGTPKAQCSTNGNSFTFQGCFPKCNLPSSTPAEYTVSGCSGSGTFLPSSCTVACAAGYQGTAVASCSAAGGTMVFSGCNAMPTCTVDSGTSIGYATASGCDTTSAAKRADECTATCDSGYSQVAGATVTATCPSNGANFVFAGCERGCSNPPTQCSTTAAYDCTGCDTASALKGSQCTVTCKSGYATNPMSDTPTTTLPAATCPISGLATLNQPGSCTQQYKCRLPTTVDSKYTVASSFTATAADPKTAQQAKAVTTCATGTSGTVTVVCSNEGGILSFYGCDPTCNKNSTTLPADADMSGCSDGSKDSQCSVSCSTGYEGTITASCSAPNGDFSFSGSCTAIKKCALPTATQGYITTNCAASASSRLSASQCKLSCDTAGGYEPSYMAASSCAATCEAGYTGTASATCAGGTHEFTFSGCSSSSVTSAAARGAQSVLGCVFAALLVLGQTYARV